MTTPRQPQPHTDGWQRMSSAPLDGTEVLIRTNSGLISCRWDDIACEWEAGWLGVFLLSGDAKNWMHLPKPPSTPIQSQKTGR